MTNGFPFSHFFNSNAKSNEKHIVTGLLKTQESSVTKNTDQDIIVNKEQDINNNKSWNKNELEFLNQEILKLLKSIINPEKFSALFHQNLKLSTITEKAAIFNVPSEFIKSMIESQFKEQIQEGLRRTLGKPYEILIQISSDKSQIDLSTFLNQSPSEPPIEKNINKNDPATFKLDLDLRQTKSDLISQAESKYINHVNNHTFSGQVIDRSKTLDNFIVGPSNNLAFATAHAVASAPGKSGKYPCLYIHSDSGLGKTHLLHAVANGIIESFPKEAICLISAREFMKELIEAYKDKKLTEFQKKYCENIDVLMIDDIHELKNKQSTQEEFFHIFNELHSRGKQLIFTSDKAPQKITGIEERIITRLQWGLVIDIQRPDLETRIAILKKKALELDLFVPDDVLTLIASSVKTSIRELEGSLIKLSASADVMDMEIDVEMARELLKLNTLEMKNITLESVAKAVSQYFKIPLADLKSKSRSKDIVKARHIAWYMSKKLINSTLKEIAKYYGGRDHSSVIHGINKITEMTKKDQNIGKDLIYLENNL